MALSVTVWQEGRDRAKLRCVPSDFDEPARNTLDSHYAFDFELMFGYYLVKLGFGIPSRPCFVNVDMALLLLFRPLDKLILRQAFLGGQGMLSLIAFFPWLKEKNRISYFPKQHMT